MQLPRAAIALTILAALIGNGDSDAFDRTVTALSVGAAQHDRPGRRLRDAGIALITIGAKPIDGEDLGQQWSKGVLPPAYRDRALGPGYRSVTLGRGRTAHFEQVFLAGRRAQVALVPLDQSAFRVEVSDDQGSRQCIATVGRCTWVPLWTTRFRIDVVNVANLAGTSFLVMQ